MHAVLFYSQLLAIAIEQIYVFVYLEYKQISLSKLNQSCRQYPVYNYAPINVKPAGKGHGIGWGFDCLCCPWGRAFDLSCSPGGGDI